MKSVNPNNPKSIVFRGLSASVYPVGIAIPAGTFITGEIKKDKSLQVKAYEGLASVVMTAVVTIGLKNIIDRDRPFQDYPDAVHPYRHETGYSLPSSHASISFATATTLSLQYKKWYVVLPAYALAAGCSYSRLYLGVHYPSDVLAGAAIGAGSALLCHWATKKIARKCSRSKEPI